MKISMNWLADFLASADGKPLSPQIAADALTMAGLPTESIENHGDDTVIDVEVTSNRSDCLSHRGVARELAALDKGVFKFLQQPVTPSDEDADSQIKVHIANPELCPHYTAHIIRGVKIGPSPGWMRRRLEVIGVRPVNNVVDVTNYVLFELGQPLHAFDLSKIFGKGIIVRTAARGEAIVSLDGRKRELNPSMLVIADTLKPVALAGVMGGMDSEVTEFTTDILLESARFDPLCIRKTARSLAMHSDSSYRFERGIDPNLPLAAGARAAELILKTAGGKLLSGCVQAGNPGNSPVSLSLRLSQIRRILGVEFPIEQIMDAFNRLRLAPKFNGEKIDVTVPSDRLDIRLEIDLVEEAARILGYDRIPTRDEISIRLAPPELANITRHVICQTLVADGYFEAVTFSFISDGLRADFGDSLIRADSAVRKADASLRPSLIPGLLEAVRLNETNGTNGAKLFEIGSIFQAKDSKVDERQTVAMVGAADVRQARGMVEAILSRLNAERTISVVPDEKPGFAAGSCGKILWGETPVGYVGKIDRAVAQKLSLREQPAAAELDWAALIKGHRHVPQLRPLPRFPAVRRDISLVVQESLAFERIQNLIISLHLADLEAVEFVTAYRGKPLEAGSKSVTISLVFRSASATLTGELVEASVQIAIAAAAKNLGATVRI
jgi:phenylalanyl-tRNA synthetase beta chain